MTSRKIIAIILSFVGVIIVRANGNLLNIEKNSVIGALYCILAAIFYNLFSVLNKKTNYNKYVSMMLFYFVSFIISLLYILLFESSFKLEGVQLLGLLWVGIFTSATAFTS